MSHSHGISSIDHTGMNGGLDPFGHKPSEALIHRPKDGGSGVRRKPAETAPEADHGPEPIRVFDEVIPVSVEGRPPDDNPNLTRVEFTAYRILPNGKKDDKPLAKGQEHLKDGKAEAELELRTPEAKAGEKPPEKYEVVFTAKHSRSKPVDSPKIDVKEAPPFEGFIFYSPMRQEYLVLETEEEWKHWNEHIKEVEALKGLTEKAYGIDNSDKRQAELSKIGVRAEDLFGKKQLGRTSNVLEELLLVKGF